MNDQGLFFDVAGCPSSQGPVIPGKPPLPWSIEHNLNLEFLQKCANVEEALELAQSYSYPFKMRTQTMFVDKTGASAIIGWINGEFKVTRKKGAYQIMTNFSVSNPELGNFPCLRYEIASDLLNKSDVSIKSFRNILSAVHHEGRVRTVYSNIYDLNQGLIYAYNHHDFENVVVIDMEDELKKGEHVIDFLSVFPKTFVGSLYTKELEFESPANKLIILGLIFFAAILFSVEGFTKWAIKKYRSEELTALKVNWSDIIIKTWVLISAVLGGVLVITVVSGMESIKWHFLRGQPMPTNSIAITLPWVHAILAAGLVVFMLSAWVKGYFTLFYRLLITAVFLTLVYLGAIMYQLNLLITS